MKIIVCKTGRGLGLTVALAAGLTLGAGVWEGHAQSYPSQPIQLIVGFTAGAGTDLSGRIYAEALSERLGVPVVVENRPGATGSIAADYVARANPDGYTLHWVEGSAVTIQPILNAELPFGPEDFTYIGKFAETGMSYVISAQVPAEDMEEFVAYASDNPGLIHYGTPGVGGSVHLATELLAMSTGIEMSHVPYGGVAAALVDLVGGHIGFALATPSAIAAYRDSPEVRILGISASQRHPSLPDVPTAEELGYPEATVTAWYGLAGPAGLPEEVTEILLSAFEAISSDPEVIAKVENINLQVVGLAGADFEQNVQDELAQWREVVEAADISLE